MSRNKEMYVAFLVDDDGNIDGHCEFGLYHQPANSPQQAVEMFDDDSDEYDRSMLRVFKLSPTHKIKFELVEIP